MFTIFDKVKLCWIKTFNTVPKEILISDERFVIVKFNKDSFEVNKVNSFLELAKGTNLVCSENQISFELTSS